MGVAILSGVLNSLERVPPPIRIINDDRSELESEEGDDTTPTRFIACVNRKESCQRVQAALREIRLGARVEVVANDNVESVRKSDVILLCCKPYMAAKLLTEAGMEAALDNKLVISVLAGVTIAQMRQWVPTTTRLVRAMPNTPCKIREGMTVVTEPSELVKTDRQIILNIFSAIGRSRFVDEKHFNACTALAGSGPAFMCTVLEAMADGGVMMGIPRDDALELAAQTMQGTARMILAGNEHPARVRDAVTSLLALEDGRLRSTIARAIEAATLRAAALGQPTN
ncbi:hypothetical protein HWV62_24081 [Athelia sp. TMB]|nr:hypothetical protein HWV62_24081 [Athelia sp. TMB]